MPPGLVLQFLGLPQVFLDGKPVATDRRKAIALLAYLSVNDIGHARQTYSRESLSALFWPDYDQSKAFSNLRRVIWEVHQAIGEDWLIADRESVQLNPDAEIDLDVARFRELISQSRQRHPALRIPFLVDAIKLYRDHFLTGFSLKDAPNFNEWAFAESEDLRRKLADALTILSADHCSLGQAEQAIPYARRLVTLDPLNEAAHRQLMEVYWQAGQNSAALKQYQTCEQILRKELNVDPQSETLALHKKIRKGEMKPAQVEKQVEITAPKNNLPLELTSFIGREKEREEIAGLLKSNRLVTLTGTGGIGKTRLSIQTASSLLDNFPDGTWLVELAPLSDPALVPQTIVKTLGLIEQAGRSPQTILTDFLQVKHLLLILDNCEHLIQACAGLTETLLQACPDLHILITSREPLGIPGEAVYLVPSLSTPELSHPVLDTLSHCEAVRLLLERAALAQPHFAITNENAPAVAQICHRLDGIPLAIELAAARLRMLSIEQISSRLDDRFRLLTGGARTALPRHQTLRALIDWSYDLLSESERILLRRLAVFAGGCTLEAAEQVCAGIGQDAISSAEILDLLTHLVDKSLLAVEEHPGHLRYRILETVRQYAEEKLSESGEGEQIRRWHLDYFLKLALDREKDIYGGRQLEWIECLEEEHGNFQTVLAWAFENDVEAAQELVVALWWSWEIRGYKSEGYEWIQKALTARQDMPDSVRAKLLSAAGWMAQDTKSSATFTEQSVALFRQFNDDIGLAFPLSSMGIDAYARGDFDKAIALTEESCKLFEKAGNKVGVRHALSILGYTYEAQGNLEKAETLYEQSLALSHEIGDFDGRAWSLNLLGRLALNRGEYLKAMELLSEGLSYSKMAKSKPNIARILTPMGIAASHIGNFDQAINFLEEALSLSRSMGDLRDILYSTRRLGMIVRIAGDYVKARALFLSSLELVRQIGDDEELGLCLINLGSLMLARGFPEKFVRLWGATENMLESFWPHAYSYFRNDIEQSVASTRATLGEETFAALYEDGKKMTLEEAVAYALES